MEQFVYLFLCKMSCNVFLIDKSCACYASIRWPWGSSSGRREVVSLKEQANANRRKDKYPSCVIACDQSGLSAFACGRVRAPVKSQEMFNLKKKGSRKNNILWPEQNTFFPPSTAPPFAFLENKKKIRTRPPPRVSSSSYSSPSSSSSLRSRSNSSVKCLDN